MPRKIANMKIGSVIAELRTERGWTLEDLADKAETTKTSISRIEGDSQWPRPELLDAIAAALGVRVYQIFALAEGVKLPTVPLRKDEEEVLREFRAMEPAAQYQYRELAKVLQKK